MTDLIPPFEGHPVTHTAVKITGRLMTDDLDGYVLSHDDVVQIRAEFMVVGVHHNTDEKTGEITRVQILKPLVMNLLPVDPSDPNDDGIIRSPFAINAKTTPQLGSGDDGE